MGQALQTISLYLLSRQNRQSHKAALALAEYQQREQKGWEPRAQQENAITLSLGLGNPAYKSGFQESKNESKACERGLQKAKFKGLTKAGSKTWEVKELRSEKAQSSLASRFFSCPAELDELYGTPTLVTVTGEPGDLAAINTEMGSSFPFSPLPHCSGCLHGPGWG